MENIDKILKESFDGFAPDAPNVWSNVSQQLGNHAVHQSVAGKVATAFKSATIVTKVLIVAALPVLGGVAYTVYQSNKPAEVQVETPLNNQTLVTIENNKLASEEPKVSDATIIKSIQKKTVNQSPKIEVTNKTQEVVVQSTENQSENKVNTPVISQSNNSQASPPVRVKSEINNQPKPKVIDRSERTQSPSKEIATINEENENLTIPDVFTPGDIDGKNDFFKILIDNEKSYYLKIFDLNDNLVFESNSKENTWDGRNYKNGQNCEEGIYSFVFIYELNNGKSATKSGKIKLIR